MDMMKFTIAPDNSSYSVTDGTEVASTKLDGGAARYRRDILGATSTVDVSWVLDREGFMYSRAFYRGVTASGSLPFLIDLILDDFELTEHKAYFVPGSMKTTGQKGLTYWVSAQLEVYPAELSGYETDLVATYNEFGTFTPAAFDRLDVIINIDWPGAL